MYYEETIINNILMWRGLPTGDWSPVTAEMIRLKKTEEYERGFRDGYERRHLEALRVLV